MFNFLMNNLRKCNSFLWLDFFPFDLGPIAQYFYLRKNSGKIQKTRVTIEFNIGKKNSDKSFMQ